jgi:hypothetical protein
VDLPKHIEKALDEQHQAAKGQALQGAAPQVSRERRAAMAQIARLEKTPREYRNLIPGNGLITGCRLVQPEGSQFVQGYYPKGPGDLRGSHFKSWEDGRRTKEEAVQQVIDWMWARHRRDVESGRDPELAPDASDCDSERSPVRGPGRGPGPGPGPGPGRGTQRGRGAASSGRGTQRGRGSGRGAAPSENPPAPGPAGIPPAVIPAAVTGPGPAPSRGRGRGGGAAPANAAVSVQPHGGGPAPPYQQVAAAVSLQASAHYICLCCWRLCATLFRSVEASSGFMLLRYPVSLC